MLGGIGERAEKENDLQAKLVENLARFLEVRDFSDATNMAFIAWKWFFQESFDDCRGLIQRVLTAPYSHNIRVVVLPCELGG